MPALVGMLFVLPLQAAVIVVETTSGSAGLPQCTLRDAISAVNERAVIGACSAGDGVDDVIVLPAVGEFVFTEADNTSTSGGPNALPVVVAQGGTLTIRGNGARLRPGVLAPAMRFLQVSGDDTYRVVLQDLHLEGFGSETFPYAGGTLNAPTATGPSRSIELERVSLRDSAVASGATGVVGQGGAIFGQTVVLRQVEMSQISGGQWGAIMARVLRIYNSTISDVRAGRTSGPNNSLKGGIRMIDCGSCDRPALVVENTTFNRFSLTQVSALDSAVISFSNSANADGVFRNVLIAGTQEGVPACIVAPGTTPIGDRLTLLGTNLATGPGCGAVTEVDEADLDLIELGEHGGPTRTIALGPDSIAIDAGDCLRFDGSPLTEDQRGVPRPDDDAAGGGDCDVGAFEYVANVRPVAQDDAWDVDAGEALQVAAPGVLENDADLEGDALTAVLLDPPSHGALDLLADGGFTYTPEPGFSGTDVFAYSADDGERLSLPAQVAIVVNEVPPVLSIDVDPAAIEFGEVGLGSKSPVQQVTLSNTGNVALTGVSLLVGSDAFALTHDCPATLPLAGQCVASLRFVPQQAGSAIGSLFVLSDAEGSPHVVLLQGTGTVPPDDVVFGDGFEGGS